MDKFGELQQTFPCLRRERLHGPLPALTGQIRLNDLTCFLTALFYRAQIALCRLLNPPIESMLVVSVTVSLLKPNFFTEEMQPSALYTRGSIRGEGIQLVLEPRQPHLTLGRLHAAAAAIIPT